ncbi:MAG TPA: cytochrome c3 family protein [Candidatus Eisenbacteria bacterium]|nr:cytochrome c3 family protein [Candidatus Eisenbacteria bacterium]
MSAESPGPLSKLLARVRSIPIRTATLTAGIFVAFTFVLVIVSVQVTSQPSFCGGTCHIMKPYYESWRHSSHKNVACVECHIPPGVNAEIKKKYEALSMVASYFTGTYGTKPWTEIEDAACLRCHERRLIMGKEMLGDVQFDHSAHLLEMRRGKTLRCTSCHSQIVQGSHIAVTTSTCILCHFKGQKAGEGTARCTLCHLNPQKQVKVADGVFDHANAEKFGMQCTWCHAQPKGSTGEVPRERCATCHNQVARLAKYGDTDLLHRKHVTEHKIDCMDCHLQLRHVEKVDLKTASTRIASAASECQACHETGHSPQLMLYTGTGGRGVPAMPSVMFAAGVRCEGCHTMALEPHGGMGGVKRASDVSCMACHGASYETIYRNWKQGSERRAAALAEQIDQTARALGGAGGSGTLLADARYNLGLVTRGHGVHNIPFAYALLGKSHDFMNQARRDRGLAPLPSPWPKPPYESPCFQCHAGIEEQRGTIFGRGYAHAPHVVERKIECMTCHRSHDQKPEGEVVRFGPSGCESCHHKTAVLQKPETCAPCHGGIKTGTVASFRGAFSHAVHIDDAEKTCADCHDLSVAPPAIRKEACKECHDD